MSSKKILVVEDNAFIRMQLVRILEDAGYETVEAEEGQDAETKLSPEVVLAVVDVMMEPVGGLGFAKYLQSEGYEKLPVILITGDNKPDLLSQAQALGVSGMLIKPVQKERLLKMTERVLRRKSGTR